MIGAVETRAGKYPARCRLQRVVNINCESLHAFIRDNTAVASLLVTDGNTAYRRLEDRGHRAINLSAVNAPPAHEVLPWGSIACSRTSRRGATGPTTACGTSTSTSTPTSSSSAGTVGGTSRRMSTPSLASARGSAGRPGAMSSATPANGNTTTRIRFSTWSVRMGWIAPRTTLWKTVATSSTRSTISGAKRRGIDMGDGAPGAPPFRQTAGRGAMHTGDTSIRRSGSRRHRQRS